MFSIHALLGPLKEEGKGGTYHDDGLCALGSVLRSTGNTTRTRRSKLNGRISPAAGFWDAAAPAPPRLRPPCSRLAHHSPGVTEGGQWGESMARLGEGGPEFTASGGCLGRRTYVRVLEPGFPPDLRPRAPPVAPLVAPNHSPNHPVIGPGEGIREAPVTRGA